MLKNIKIENFKCFENEIIDLKPLTLITGTNSSGKSSLLQAILLLGDHKDLEITNYLQTLGSFDDLKNKYINPDAYYINAEFSDGQNASLTFCKKIETWIQLASATACNSSNNTSFGVFIPSVFLGRLFKRCIMNSKCSSSKCLKHEPLGQY